ncbi:hypothetical protein C2857_006066 [Epichloe festucae Fl1]|uniref:WKF domain-containing protein n=1 Tax=Epichloe festucae (strain Fl1) TaxID=877507 RepID=A0A7S9PU27_EPIFF|nr:hypothetical protein C2857_006066 [Epichloe festucae Fl1]
MTSSQGATAQQVPAWKRLGLKLKQPGAAPDSAIGTPAVGHPSSSQHEAQSNKRKVDAPPATTPSSAFKRPRREIQGRQITENNSHPRKKKLVTFGDTPTRNGNTTGHKDSNTDNKSPKPKKSKGPAKKQTPVEPTDIKPALDYLRQWKSSRDSWKFNKNLQSLLIKRVFDADVIPTSDIDTFYEYIRDLKGFVRTRLHETAMEVRTRDVADGPSGFPSGTKDLESKQESYETLLSDLLRAQHLGQKRKGYDEVEFIASSSAGDVIIRRVVKRMRAELIIDDLSDGEQTDTSRTTQSSDNTLTTSDNHVTMTTDGDKQVKLNDGTAKRRRKLRVNVDDSSSSGSDSDSDSDSSSSSSDDSDDSESDDDADGDNQEDDGYESSSSSSSSSSSADESDSDDDSADDDD